MQNNHNNITLSFMLASLLEVSQSMVNNTAAGCTLLFTNAEFQISADHHCTGGNTGFLSDHISVEACEDSQHFIFTYIIYIYITQGGHDQR